jgi:hypothetical protein
MTGSFRVGGLPSLKSQLFPAKRRAKPSVPVARACKAAVNGGDFSAERGSKEPATQLHKRTGKYDLDGSERRAGTIPLSCGQESWRINLRSCVSAYQIQNTPTPSLA